MVEQPQVRGMILNQFLVYVHHSQAIIPCFLDMLSICGPASCVGALAAHTGRPLVRFKRYLVSTHQIYCCGTACKSSCYSGIGEPRHQGIYASELSVGCLAVENTSFQPQQLQQ